MFHWLKSAAVYSPAAAYELLRQGNAPGRLRIRGPLDLSNCQWLTYLPRELQAESVNVSSCTNLRGLPERLACNRLFLRQTNIRCLSAGLNVQEHIDAENCRGLESVLPLRVRQLSLRGCSSLERLEPGVVARGLDLNGCSRLVELPTSIVASVAVLDLTDCTSLTSLPEGFARLEHLNVSGCTRLESLPEGMRIRSSIDVAGCGLRALPWSLRSVRILWRGRQVSDRIAFDRESITVAEILGEQNVTMRRLLLERVGMEWFLDRTQSITVDHDHDAGGDRRLLRIAFPSGEDVACIEVRCPSTGNRYVLRVPPQMTSCIQAAAWLAGYANPERYRPVAET